MKLKTFKDYYPQTESKQNKESILPYSEVSRLGSTYNAGESEVEPHVNIRKSVRFESVMETSDPYNTQNVFNIHNMQETTTNTNINTTNNKDKETKKENVFWIKSVEDSNVVCRNDAYSTLVTPIAWDNQSISLRSGNTTRNVSEVKEERLSFAQYLEQQKQQSLRRTSSLRESSRPYSNYSNFSSLMEVREKNVNNTKSRNFIENTVTVFGFDFRKDFYTVREAFSRYGKIVKCVSSPYANYMHIQYAEADACAQALLFNNKAFDLKTGLIIGVKPCTCLSIPTSLFEKNASVKKAERPRANSVCDLLCAILKRLWDSI